jgi:pimeloyl-ACP methyl ester carboxylesterase
VGRGRINEGRHRRTAGRLLAVALSLPLVLTTSASSAATRTPPPVSVATVQALLVARATSGHLSQAWRAAGPRASAASPPSPCGETPGLLCSEIDVPLDRTGLTPGTITLHVELLPAEGVPRGVMFLIAGGPGQGSAHVFSLGAQAAVASYRFLFPGYTLVAYDDRGTGDSGLIDCPALQKAITADQQRSAAADCANVIGPSRTFYGTAEHADDLESVRRFLGVDKVALFGVSYGTKLAEAYALAYPNHVERLLLDSVLPPELPDPYGSNVLRDLPGTLDSWCSDGSCRVATPSFSADVVATANALAAKPLTGTVLVPNSRTGLISPAPERLDGIGFLSMILDADLNPGLASELPAVVHAFRQGNPEPLLRLAKIHDGSAASPSEDLSFGLYAATVCRDGPFPWAPTTPIAQRQAIFNAAVAALSPGTLGPFGSWAARFGNADFCLKWPEPSGGGSLGAGPLPNVPVLAISGGFDMRTPTEGAASIVSRFPQGQLLVIPGVGHSVTTADPSGCAPQAVHSWMLGGAVPGSCPRSLPLLPPIPALPAPGPLKPKRPASPRATYAIAVKTIKEAEAIWLTAQSVVGGVFGGKIVPAPSGPPAFSLVGYSIVHGVTLTGKLQLTKLGLPLNFAGTLSVAGKGAAAGIIGVSGSSIRGTLGGVLVGK